MRGGVIGAVLLAVGAVCAWSGVLPAAEAEGLASRTWPVLLFVAAISVVSGLCAEAGVFRLAVSLLTRSARGRTRVLWAAVVLLAAACTVFLSLDTTAVLLTPVVVLAARESRVAPLPFALAVVWLANTASLLLPISNLTNLLAQGRMDGVDAAAFARLTWAPAVVAVIVPMLVLLVVERRALAGRHERAEERAPADVVTRRLCLIVLAVLLPLLVSGLPPWLPSCAAAAVLLVVFRARGRAGVGLDLVPWSTLLLAAGLFSVFAVAHALGLGEALAVVSGEGTAMPDLLRLSFTGMVSANLVNNLPAYLALEPSIDGEPLRAIALLIGVNVGAIITPWASLATMLWHDRSRSAGEPVRWRSYVMRGVLVAPVTVALATVALAVAAGA